MPDKNTVRHWIDDLPDNPPTATGHRLRRKVWRYLVETADEQGQIRITAAQIAEAIGQGRSQPPTAKGVKAATAWLRKRGLLLTAEAAAGGNQANTYQLATTPPPDARPRRPAQAEPDPATATAAAWLAEDLADEHLAEDIAHWVAGIWAVRDGGPGWEQTARQVRPELDQLPEAGRRHYTRGLITALREEGWLRYTRDEGSLAAGPRLKNRHQVATAARHSTGVADRGF